jgi:hydrogenase maturation protease
VKTLILGIGNTIVGDDGIGVHVAQELAKRINDDNIDVMDADTSGLGLLENIAGYDKVIIIDAIETGSGDIGVIYKLRLEDLVNTMDQTSWPHGMNFATAIDLGRKFAANQMPKEMVIFAIGIGEVTKFTEEMTARVAETVPEVANLVLEEIGWAHRALLR